MSRVNPVYREQVDHYLDQHRAFEATRSDDPAWLRSLRRDAIERFGELGFPSTRLEEWRYTNVAGIAKRALALEGAGGSTAGTPGLEAADLRERLARCPDAKDQAFRLLNDAFISDLARVSFAANQDEPIQLRLACTTADAVRHPRVLVDVAPGTQATLVLDLDGAAGLTNLVADIDVGDDASLELVIAQPGSARSAHFHVTSVSARVARNGRLRSRTLTSGGTLVRNDLDVVLAGEGAECRLEGLFLAADSQLVDNHTSVDHAVPHCSSHELYKGILADRARGVFRGRVLVRPDAQKTDATQSNPNLLLGAGAEIDTKPQLEIYADDVKCSHGATVGQLDEDALFYLRSRGIGEGAARALLVRAFAAEILDTLPEDTSSPGAGAGIAPAIARSLEQGLESLLEGSEA